MELERDLNQSLVGEPLPDEDSQFWLHASQPGLSAIWDNPQDDVYAQLLEE